MEVLIIIIAALILLWFSIWLAGFICLNDFSVPPIPINRVKKSLIVFPHADDEALTTSGFMRKAALAGIKVTWVILTKGERGNPTATVDPKLKTIRTQEVKHVAKLLNVTKVIQEDFGDGMVAHKKKEVAKFLMTIFQSEQPDLVITYDLSGWYGHPDHIATTEIVNEILQTKFPEISLWYASLPKKVWALAGGLPTHMAKNPKWIHDRTYPNGKVFVGLNVLQTVRAVYLYKSQQQSFRQSIPFAPVPMWFFISMGWFVYFYQVR